ncbi:MAG: GNAT family N-acetyltransferase [Anaerolineae bacterium]|nr:GNAT family N-acetyltransferase [Anaerolineae bacterium]
MESLLALVKPAPAYQSAFWAMVADYRAAGEMRYQALVDFFRRDFEGYLRHLRNMSRGVGLKPGMVPYTVYWSVKPGLPIIVGEFHLRHWLTPALEKEGGHIGYTITPSLRGQGYGTQQLRLGLERAREFGLDRVLITCDTDNIASARVIQKNGGAFIDEVISDRSGKPVSRYWIDL